ncbi:hypothetical protein AALB16_05425 [Lachnospiraceae bacterium 62-35]
MYMRKSGTYLIGILIIIFCFTACVSSSRQTEALERAVEEKSVPAISQKEAFESENQTDVLLQAEFKVEEGPLEEAIVDEEGVKITPIDWSFADGRLTVLYQVENQTEQSIVIVSGMGGCVNGWVIHMGMNSVELGAGETKEVILTQIEGYELNRCGISQIHNIETSFMIDFLSDHVSYHTGMREIKEKSLVSGEKIQQFSENTIYRKNGLIISAGSELKERTGAIVQPLYIENEDRNKWVFVNSRLSAMNGERLKENNILNLEDSIKIPPGRKGLIDCILYIKSENLDQQPPRNIEQIEIEVSYVFVGKDEKIDVQKGASKETFVITYESTLFHKAEN